MWWTSSSGRIGLDITLTQARAAAHPGPCDADVLALPQVPAIRRQLDEISPAQLAAELREYGAWSDQELADHEQNLQRLLWLACGDLVEQHPTLDAAARQQHGGEEGVKREIANLKRRLRYQPEPQRWIPVAGETRTTADYVAEFEKMNHLKRTHA